jgi:endonuclease/exonuclease/phosphatase family metal-dependent hydrolase
MPRFFRGIPFAQIEPIIETRYNTIPTVPKGTTMESQTMRPTVGNEECEDLAQLEADIQGCLRHCLRDFRMTVRDGGLVLYGLTRTYYGKQLAQHGVMARSRLPIRANRIVVL